jgi:hypothetical protein
MTFEASAVAAVHFFFVQKTVIAQLAQRRVIA